MSQPQPTNTKPFVYRLIKGLWSVVCGAVILAFAIMGAYAKVKSGNQEIRMGIAVLVIGALAAPLIERIFDRWI
jgi:hypothetical protein